ncbi:SPFH domain-containing protein [Sporolituus thermophilus]|uniref:SPFH domain, Band 7 family protein n=1 Tax=Sporolituus thermophilus DSM 23256 TaxID=1123285 RepID=A0A1G7N2Z9_9FIRM|nr:SPFH domain-containing protein [Sporolituus thermophilus]SDF68311.1 SPFH domain, Band 7 family protein [Sporolituus thermophilus DSM 23256]
MAKKQNLGNANPPLTMQQPQIGPCHRPSWFPFNVFMLSCAAGIALYAYFDKLWLAAAVIIAGTLLSMSVRVAAEWEKAVVLRLGKYKGLKGPGHFWLIPFIDTVAYWIDQRIVATPFLAEQTLTKDTVPVNVDAILFWVVWDPEKAALEVENYREAVAWTAQTALRDVVGRTMLSELLSERENLDKILQEVIDRRTEPWGITVQSVEIRDVIIPEALQEAMSREAQAERERRARIILGTTETEIAHRFAAAAKVYENNPIALQLRAMNILYEGLKEKGSLVVTPSGVADALNLGAIAAITKGLEEKKAEPVREEAAATKEMA